MSSTQELFRDDAYLRACEARVLTVEPFGVVLDRTVFYPMGGGQPGDQGFLRWVGGEARVIDARRDKVSGALLHILAPDAARPAPGTAVTAHLDWARRHRIMRMHTTLHLLSALVGGAVTGGAIGDGRGRLDFDLPDPSLNPDPSLAPAPSLDRGDLTARLARLVDADHPVSARWIAEEELDARPDLVRTMSVGPPRGVGPVRLVAVAGVDLQACGGTHLARTGEIGAVEVVKIEKKGRHSRRVRLALRG